MSLVREIAKDAFVKIVLHNGVDIQKVAHAGRYQPAELRTALLLGPAPDFEGLVCCEPGCGRGAGLEFDHVTPIAAGGLTSIHNERLRCTPHHRQKPERDRRMGLLESRDPFEDPP
jgi:5-methylcytosine-specific restriction endonuclease McrA